MATIVRVDPAEPNFNTYDHGYRQDEVLICFYSVQHYRCRIAVKRRFAHMIQPGVNIVCERASGSREPLVLELYDFLGLLEAPY